MPSDPPQLVPLIRHFCEVCGEPTTLWCSRCCSAWYCCSDHLELDWNQHRQNCRSVQSAGNDPDGQGSIATARYTSQSVFGILFPSDEERPRLIQLSCRARIDPSTGGVLAWQPMVHAIVGDEHPHQIVLEHGIAGDNLRFPMQLWSRTPTSNDHSPINRSIYRLTKGQAPYPWKGSFVALKFSGTRRQGYVDMSLNDLPALVSYFLQANAE